MRRFRRGIWVGVTGVALALLGLASPAAAQSITAPAEIKVPTPGLVIVRADKVDADEVHWYSLTPGLQVFPSDIVHPPTGTYLGFALQEGTYRIGAVPAKAVKQADGSFRAVIGQPVYVTVTVGDPRPVTPMTFTPPALPPGALQAAYSQSVAVGGGTGDVLTSLRDVQNLTGLTLVPAGNRVAVTGTPTAPGTTSFTVVGKDSAGATQSQAYTITVSATPPPPPPPPVPPAPIPDKGLRVLLTYDSKAVTAMPKEQQAILFAKEVRDYLNANTPLGPDGKTHEWRIWDSGLDAGGDPSAAMKALYARPRAAPNWIAVGNGVAGYEGPLPANTAEALALIRKYAP